MSILLIDDHPLILDGLKTLIEKKFPHIQIEICQFPQNLEQVLTARSAESWKAFIIDMNFNGQLLGIELTKTLKARFPKVPVMVLSMYSEPHLITRVLDAGAMSYVVKTDAPSEIHRAVADLLEGRAYTSSSVPKDLSSGDQPNLTGRELEIARYVADGISSKLIGEKLNISVRTVETHRKNILKKVKVKNTAELVSYLQKNALL